MPIFSKNNRNFGILSSAIQTVRGPMYLDAVNDKMAVKNKEYYLAELRRLKELVHEQYPGTTLNSICTDGEKALGLAREDIDKEGEVLCIWCNTHLLSLLFNDIFSTIYSLLTAILIKSSLK